MENKKINKRLSILFVLLIALVFATSATILKAAQGPDPSATIKLDRIKVGSGIEKPAGNGMNETNGYKPGVSINNENGDYVASNDQVTYNIQYSLKSDTERFVEINLVIPEGLTFAKSNNPKFCVSNEMATASYNGKDAKPKCTFKVTANGALDFDSNIVLTAKDSNGEISSDQVLSANVGLKDANPYQTVAAKAVKVISAPTIDLKIVPNQCPNYGNTCTQTIHTTTTGNFLIAPVQINFPGYTSAFGKTALANVEYTAKVDVSKFPTGTIWKVGANVLPVENGKVQLPPAKGNTTLTFTVPDNKWGGAEYSEAGEVRSFDVQLIPDQNSIKTKDYKNNGEGYLSGMTTDKNNRDAKAEEVKAPAGNWYVNNKYTKWENYSPKKEIPEEPDPEEKPGPETGGPGTGEPEDVPMSIRKTVYRPWSASNTYPWNDVNRFFGKGGERVAINKNGASYGNANATAGYTNNMVAPGTEFEAELMINVEADAGIKPEIAPKFPVYLYDFWDASEVEATSVTKLKGDVYDYSTIEWCTDGVRNNMTVSCESGWKKSNTPIKDANSVRFTYDKGTLVLNATAEVKLGFKIKDNLEVDGKFSYGKATAFQDFGRVDGKTVGNDAYRVEDSSHFRTPNKVTQAPFTTTKKLYRPYDPLASAWDDIDKYFDAGGVRKDTTDNTGVGNGYKPYEVVMGTEFEAELNFTPNSNYRFDVKKNAITAYDIWDASQVKAVSVTKTHGSTKVTKTEWCTNAEIDATTKDLNCSSGWKASETPIANANAFKLTINDGEAKYNELNKIIAKFEVRDDMGIDYSTVVKINDNFNIKVKPIELRNDVVQAVTASMQTPGKLPLKAVIKGSVDPIVLNNDYRTASYDFRPVVQNPSDLNEKIKAQVEIELNANITEVSNIDESKWKVVSFEPGDGEGGLKGKLVLEPKDGYFKPGAIMNKETNLPPITFDVQYNFTVIGDLDVKATLTVFDIEDKTSVASDIVKTKAIKTANAGSLLSSDTLKIEKDRVAKAKYKYIGISEGEEVKGKTNKSTIIDIESVIILPKVGAEDAYANEIKNSYKNFNGVLYSNFSGSYKPELTLDKSISTNETIIKCTEDANPSFDATKGNYKDSCDASKIRAYKIIMKQDIENELKDEAIAAVDLKLNTNGNKVGDNYVVYSGPVYANGTLKAKSQSLPKNIRVVSSKVSGHVYWDAYKGGSAWKNDYESIEDIEVELFDANNKLVGTATTDDEGYYSFDNLYSGTYTAKVKNAPKTKEIMGSQVGVINSFTFNNDKNNNESGLINLGMDKSKNIIDFGYYAGSPYSDIIKDPADASCPEKELAPGETPKCDINWNINIKSGRGDGSDIEFVEAKIGKVVTNGYNQAWALTTDGAVYAWGSNINGSLGVGSEEAIIKTPMKVDIDARIAEITPSNNDNVSSNGNVITHTLFLSTDGRLFGAGLNAGMFQNGGNYTYDAFGTGKTVSKNLIQYKPVEINYHDSIPASEGEIVEMATTPNVSLLLMSSGNVYRTGYGYGMGTRNPQVTSMWDVTTKWAKMPGVRNIESIASNLGAVITIDANKGVLTTWGINNIAGQANNTSGGTSAAIPTFSFSDEGGYTKIVSNNYATYAINANGNLYGWGRKTNVTGKENDDESFQPANQIKIPGDGAVEDVKYTGNILLVKTKDGKVYYSTRPKYNTEETAEATHALVLNDGNGAQQSINKLTEIDSKYFNDNYAIAGLSGLEVDENGVLNVWGRNDIGIVPTELLNKPTNTTYTDKVEVKGDWALNEGVVSTIDGASELTNLEFNDTVSSNVTITQAELVKKTLISLNGEEIKDEVIGEIKPVSSETANGFTTYTYKLDDLYPGYQYALNLSGTVTQNKNASVIANQAWVNSNEVEKAQPVVPSTASIKPNEEGEFAVTSGKLDAANNKSTCAINNELGKGTTNCDQVFAAILGNDQGRDAKLEVEKTSDVTDGSKLVTGSKVNYTIKVKNTGNVDLENVTVKDTFNGQADLQNDLKCENSVEGKNNVIALIEPNESKSCTVTYTIDAKDFDLTDRLLKNHAEAETKNPLGGDNLKDNDDEDIELAEKADGKLSIIKENNVKVADAQGNDIDFRDLKVGSKVIYTFKVKNEGNVKLENLKINDDAAKFTGKGSLSEIKCPVTVLEANGNSEGKDSTECSATYTLVKEDFESEKITNVANASATIDTNATTNAKEVVNSNDDSSEFKIPKSSYMIEKTAAYDKLAVGQKMDYTITIKNTGDTKLKDITIKDVFTGKGTNNLQSELVCDGNDDKKGNVISELNSQETKSCKVSYTIVKDDFEDGEISNTASAEITNPSTGEKLPGDGSSAVTELPDSSKPVLSLTKENDVKDFTTLKIGDIVTYTFTLENKGNVALENLEIIDKDKDFTGNGELDLSKLNCDLSTKLEKGKKLVCTLEYKLVKADFDEDFIKNTATATSTVDVDAATDAGDKVDANEDSTQFEIPNPEIKIEKNIKDIDNIDPNKLKENDFITYTFDVTNTGNVLLKNINVDEDDFNGNGTLETIMCDGSEVIPELAAGATAHCEAKYQLVRADFNGEILINHAHAITLNPAYENEKVTPRSSAPYVRSDVDFAQIQLRNATTPNLSIVKSNDVEDYTKLKVGDTYKYLFTVTNYSNVKVDNLTILEDKDAFTGNGQISDINCPVNSLEVNESTTCEAEYTLTREDFDQDEIFNKAKASATIDEGAATMGGETIFTEDSDSTLKTPKVVDIKEPTLNDADCDKKPTLTIPEVEGVNYIVKEEKNKYVVEAEINKGYINIDQNDKWELNYQVKPCPIDTLPTTGNNALFIALSLVTLLTITGVSINLRKNYLN